MSKIATGEWHCKRSFRYWIFGLRALCRLRNSDFRFLIACCVVAGSFSGCSGNNAASVSGSITLDGQPLAGANVSFYPDGDANAPAYGQTDSQGRYSLSTGSESGLAPGKYVAVVVATKEPAQPYDATGAEVPPTLVTPAKYADANKSDLKVEVKAGRNDIPLSLVSAKAAGS